MINAYCGLFTQTEYFKIENFAMHNIKEVANRNLAVEQNAEMQVGLEKFGSEVIDIGELPGHPNSVFTQEMVVVMPKGYIKMSMGIATRQEEEGLMASAFDSLNLFCVGEITELGQSKAAMSSKQRNSSSKYILSISQNSEKKSAVRTASSCLLKGNKQPTKINMLSFNLGSKAKRMINERR